MRTLTFADRVVNVCRSSDVESLQHCASALANVAIFGGAENQEAMIQRKVPSWLFLLANNKDHIVRYYGCLAIAVLVSNKEMEAAVQKSGTLDLIEPFVQAHTPAEFAITSATHSHGQSSSWLQRLMPVLLSNREEARNLAAFHFCMEAEIKKAQVCELCLWKDALVAYLLESCVNTMLIPSLQIVLWNFCTTKFCFFFQKKFVKLLLLSKSSR